MLSGATSFFYEEMRNQNSRRKRRYTQKLVFTETIIMFMNNTGEPNIFRKSSICHISLVAYSQTIRVSKLKTATMGKKLNGRLFRVNGKPFRVNGELFRVHGKLFHIDFSSCEGSFLAIIGMFGWVVRRFQEASPSYFLYFTRKSQRYAEIKSLSIVVR